jgi:glycosyltransferase involved in cell wall biosynthesis
LEATLGGTRRYIEDIAATTIEAPIIHGLAYGTSRADTGFPHLLDRARSAGWFLSQVDAMRRPMNIVDDALSVAKVRRAIHDFNPSILHAHSAKAGGIGRLAALSCARDRPRLVYSPHALPTRLGRRYTSAERVLATFTDRFIADSESERREIVDEGIAEETRIDVVSPRIDAAHFRAQDRRTARRDLGLPDDAPIIIGIGRLAPQKDPLTFAAMIALLRSIEPRVIGVWVGDGELRNKLEAEAERLQLGGALRVTGWVRDVRPYIASCDVLLSTSLYESFGYFVAEAFAMERPVVATRVTGTVDIFFPEADSFLYAIGNRHAALISLKRLLDDPAMRLNVGRMGRLEMLRKFSDSAMHTALYSAYNAALT